MTTAVSTYPSAYDDLSGSVASAPVTIVVCSSCKFKEEPETAARAGLRLATETRRAATGSAVRVAHVECLGNCARGLSAAILRRGCWSYVFGDLGVESGGDLVAAAKLFAQSPDGLMPWRERPQALKRGLVARIPHMTELKDLP